MHIDPLKKVRRLSERILFLEANGLVVQSVKLIDTEHGLKWSAENDRSHVFVNIGGRMDGFDASAGSCLFPGSPTLGEFSTIPPDAAFAGHYGVGSIRFLAITPRPSWPAPRWPRLAGFDIDVLRAAKGLGAALEEGRTAEVVNAAAALWTHVVGGEDRPVVRRSALLTEARFEAVQRLVAEALPEIGSATDLADRTGVSLDSLNTSFQRRLGVSAARYLEDCRVRTARRMLCLTEEPTAQIALAAGFSSQSHLTDRMNVRLGVTPARLRSLLRGT